MTTQASPLNVLWFLPTHGDGRHLGASVGAGLLGNGRSSRGVRRRFRVARGGLIRVSTFGDRQVAFERVVIRRQKVIRHFPLLEEVDRQLGERQVQHEDE